MPTIELTKTFPPDTYVAALESWAWIGLTGTTPLFTSLFGDIFLEGAAGISMLSILSGTLEHVGADQTALAERLATEDGQDHFLLAGLAFGAHRRGVLLEPNQIYDFQPPPILGGPTNVDHMIPTDFVIAFNINGHIHDQVRHHKPGTKISSINLHTTSTTSERQQRPDTRTSPSRWWHRKS